MWSNTACTSFKLKTVTWHWVFGDPLGARVQRVERCAHLLAVWHLPAGRQGEQLEEGAQKERAVDWGTRHGRRTATRQTALNQPPAINFSTIKVTRGSRSCAEVKLQLPDQLESASLRFVFFFYSPPAQHSVRLESSSTEPLGECTPMLMNLSPSSLVALTLSSMHRWTSPGYMRAPQREPARSPPLV